MQTYYFGVFIEMYRIMKGCTGIKSKVNRQSILNSDKLS